MEQCVGGVGSVLLQRWTSTIALSTGAGTDSTTVPTALLNFSNASSHVSLVGSHVSVLGHRFVQALPNITDYEANRAELGNALAVNISVFVIGFFLWGIFPCIAACRKTYSAEDHGWSIGLLGASRIARPAAGRSASEASGLDANQPDSSQSGMHADVAKRNYLLYLLVCMYACIFLSIVNICFLLPHGLVESVLFGGSILMVLGQVSFVEMYLITFVDGCIVLAFSRIFEELIELPERDSAMGQLRRTVWLQGLPTHDSTRWWKPFRVNPLLEGRAKHDLMDALTDALMDPHQDAQTSASSSSQNPTSDAPSQHVLLGSKASRHVASAPALGTVPATPPPVNLQGTSWQCCLANGNPYYINTHTGAVQWEVPSALAAFSTPADSPVVEEIYVASVLDEWYRIHTDLQRAQEKLAAYEEKSRKTQLELADAEISWLWGVLLRPSLMWCEHRVKGLRPTIVSLTKDLERTIASEKLMSGSAFVTFKQARFRDQLLEEEVDQEDPLSTLLASRSYSYFSFGRPPFASVTLTCQRAPHPSDVNFENLHVAWWQRELVFWTLASLLLFVMVVLVTVVRISEFVVPVVQVAREDLHALEQMQAWNDYVPESVKQFAYQLDQEVVWKSILEQLPTMCLLFINSVMVPAAISAIAACERPVKLSDAERTRMLVNFFFLFMNTVVVPFCGVASLNELLGVLIKALQEQANPEVFKGLIFASPGIFALKYIMNATFITSANQLLQVTQRASRWCGLTFLAVTDRQIQDFQKPWEFFWGYWYAWTLSVFALGISMSVACPGTLPIAALFFFVKYQVDKHNLDNGVYSCGTDVEGGLAVGVVCYIRVVVAVWWLAMGSLSYTIGVFDPHATWSPEEEVGLQRGGIMLVVTGALTFIRSWWLRTEQFHRLRLLASSRKLDNSDPTCWERMGEMLLLKATPQRSGSPSSASAPVALESTVKDEIHTLSWDGAELLGLKQKLDHSPNQ